MSVTKINGFRAPYRSLTLRNEKDAIIRRNGVLAIDGDVYEFSGNVIIPPFTVVQQGIIIKKDTQTTVPFPSGLDLPFYVTVSTPTAANIDDLSFQFASSPYEVAVNETILAEYDGIEFRQMPFVSIDGIIRDQHKINVDLGNIGPQSGLQTQIDGSNYKNLKGVIIDPVGRTLRLDEDYITPIIQADPLWDRVDRIVYRLPLDEENRIGKRQLVVGNTFTTGTQNVNDTVLATGYRHNQVKSVVDSLNNLHTFTSRGFGDSFTIYHTKYNSDRGTQMEPLSSVVAATSEYFDVIVDSSNNLHLVYIDGLHVKHLKLNSIGGIISGPFTLDTGSIQCDMPQIKTDPLYSKLYIIFTSRIAVGNRQLFFTSRTLSGSLVTSPVRITNTVSDIINPNFVVTNDYRLYVAYEDLTLTSIYYLITDDIGASIQTPVLVSGATGSTSFGTLSGQAKNPVIGVSDNKHLFIAFRQRKTLSDYGIAIYHDGTAFLPNLLSPSENFVSFDMVVDDFMNELHISAAQGTRLDYIKVDGLTTIFNVQLNSSGAYDTHVLKDIWGSLLHSWTLPLSTSFTNVGTPQDIDYIGNGVVAGALNTLVLAANELSFTIASLTQIPVLGEQIEIAGSTSNDGFYLITAVRTESIDAPSDVLVVSVSTNFAAPELPCPGTAQMADPDGNDAHFVKTVSDISKTRSLRTDVLDTDILLTRCLFPGPTLLNYFNPVNPQVNSDLFGMYGDIDVDWGASTPGALTMTTGASIVHLISYFKYDVLGGTFPMINGDALFVILDGVTTPVTPQVTPIVSLPWGLPIQVLGFVENNEFVPHLFSVAGMGELSVGETIVLGQELPKILRNRLGLTSETSFQAYTSTLVISPSDNYPQAISKLDSQLAFIASDVAKEEIFTVTAPGGQDEFELTTFTFSASNAVPDLQVRINDRVKTLDQAGGTAEDYYKMSNKRIKFTYMIPQGNKVIIREERTGGLLGGGSAVDLQNITVEPSPITNAAYSLGTVSKAWKSVFIKDKITSQVYELEVVNGSFAFTPRP